MRQIISASAKDWDFKDADTNYLTHNYHSYPAKFIPQIPRKLIETYSKQGDVVLDPFCGCGGTIVEAKLLGRNSIGVDVNPLACLISKVKSTPINDEILQGCTELLVKIEKDINTLYGQRSLDTVDQALDYNIPVFYNIDYWFQEHVQKELAIIKRHIDMIRNEDFRNFCLVGLSSIINRVSNMESETRYARVPKSIKPKDTFYAFRQKMTDMVKRMKEFNNVCKNVTSKIYCADTRNLNFIKNGDVDLVVTSPPYIYAWDYTLIHRFRLFWLGISRDNIIELQKNEIGSHLRLERKQKEANDRSVAIDDYTADMMNCLQEMERVCKSKGRCCIVIGGSRLEGKIVESDKILTDLGNEVGFELENKFVRMINPARKSTNVLFARIKREHILIFKKA